MSTTLHTDGSLLQRIERLEKQIKRDRQGMDRGVMMTAIIGALLLCALAVYFSFGYREIASFVSAENLVSWGETYGKGAVGDLRESAQRTIKEQAPTWAEVSSRQMRDSLPEGRVRLQAMLLDMFANVLKGSAKQSKDVFSEFLAKNRAMVKEGLHKLSGSPAESEAFLTDLTKALEEQLDGDVKSGAKQVLDLVVGLNDNLQRCQTQQRLTQIQAMQKEIFMLVKRLFLDEAPAETPVPAPPTPQLAKPDKKGA